MPEASLTTLQGQGRRGGRQTFPGPLSTQPCIPEGWQQPQAAGARVVKRWHGARRHFTWQMLGPEFRKAGLMLGMWKSWALL